MNYTSQGCRPIWSRPQLTHSPANQIEGAQPDDGRRWGTERPLAGVSPPASGTHSSGSQSRGDGLGDGLGTALRALQVAAAFEVSTGQASSLWSHREIGQGLSCTSVHRLHSDLLLAGSTSGSPCRCLTAQASRCWMPWAASSALPVPVPTHGFLLLPQGFLWLGGCKHQKFSLRGQPSTNGRQELGHKYWLPHFPPHMHP